MDLKAFVAGERPYVGDRGFAGIVQRPPRKPLIAAIEGFAVAGGLEVALACDLIVAARDAKLGIPEVKRSLVAAGGALLRLPRRMPYGLAMELALTGDPITAERGAEIGLVNRLAEPAGRSTRRSSSPGRSPATARSRSTATKRILQRRTTGARRSSGRARARSRARSSARRTRARARSPSPRSASPSGRAAEHSSPLSVRAARGPPAVAVLAEVDALPGAQLQAPVGDRER